MKNISIWFWNKTLANCDWAVIFLQIRRFSVIIWNINADIESVAMCEAYGRGLKTKERSKYRYRNSWIKSKVDDSTTATTAPANHVHHIKYTNWKYRKYFYGKNIECSFSMKIFKQCIEYVFAEFKLNKLWPLNVKYVRKW